MTGQLAEWKALSAKIPILSLEEMRALPEPKEYDAGVYFLWLNSGLTYIGKSKHVCERLYHQALMNKNLPFYVGKRAKEVPFDDVTCLVLQSGPICPPGLEGLLTRYERAYIAAYQPAYNQDYQNGFT